MSTGLLARKNRQIGEQSVELFLQKTIAVGFLEGDFVHVEAAVDLELQAVPAGCQMTLLADVACATCQRRKDISRQTFARHVSVRSIGTTTKRSWP